MRALAESLPEFVAGHDRVIAVVSILDDKDAAGMLARLIGAERVHIDALVFTNSHNPRTLPPPTLQSLTRQLMGPPTEVVPGPRQALARARELAGPEGVVIAAGSLYLVADLLATGPREHASSL
jgi:dihydrofolate synthase/folylpolyglutamate synthase